MLHGRHDRRKIEGGAETAMPAILCDQDEFGKAIGEFGVLRLLVVLDLVEE
jgi:hypothetical protein